MRKNNVTVESNFDISLFDGRYSQVVQRLKEYFSDYASIKNKVKLELYWLRFWIESVKDSGVVSKNDVKNADNIIKIYEQFSYASYQKIKQIEENTGNELQAIETYIVQELKKVKLKNIVSLAGMNCSIEDIEETAYAMMIKEAVEKAWIPSSEQLIKVIEGVNIKEEMYMLSQDNDSEGFTTLESELKRYATRLEINLERIKGIQIGPKSGVILDKQSPMLSKNFIEQYLGLSLEADDYMVCISDNIRLSNNILLQFNRDMLSLDYFKISKEQESSSRYESSEIDINVSNLMFMNISNKMSKEFYITKNLLLAFGHSMQAMERTIAELVKLNTD